MDALKSWFNFGYKVGASSRGGGEGQEMDDLSDTAQGVLASIPTTSTSKSLTPGIVTPLTKDPAAAASSESLTEEVVGVASSIATSSLERRGQLEHSKEFLINEAIIVLEEQATLIGSNDLTFEDLDLLLPNAITVAYGALHRMRLRFPIELSEEGDQLAYRCLKMARDLLVAFHETNEFTAEISLISTIFGSNIKNGEILDQFDSDDNISSVLIVVYNFYENQKDLFIKELMAPAKTSDTRDASSTFKGPPTTAILRKAMSYFSK